jgi:hypothetical protein
LYEIDPSVEIFGVNILTLFAGQQGKIVNNYGTLFLTLALIVGDSIGIFFFLQPYYLLS